LDILLKRYGHTCDELDAQTGIEVFKKAFLEETKADVIARYPSLYLHNINDMIHVHIYRKNSKFKSISQTLKEIDNPQDVVPEKGWEQIEQETAKIVEIFKRKG
jgi:hypothetical protein